jgi:predicted Mrr-cat superfamily restriction endonuclease
MMSCPRNQDRRHRSFPPEKDRADLAWRVTGEYTYDASESYPNLHRVDWMKKFPRTTFSQGALYEIGSAMSFFQVKNYADEFAARRWKAKRSPRQPLKRKTRRSASSPMTSSSNHAISF